MKIFYFEFKWLSSRYIFQVKTSLQSYKMIMFCFYIFSCWRMKISNGIAVTIEEKTKTKKQKRKTIWWWKKWKKKFYEKNVKLEKISNVNMVKPSSGMVVDIELFKTRFIIFSNYSLFLKVICPNFFPFFPQKKLFLNHFLIFTL